MQSRDRNRLTAARAEALLQGWMNMRFIWDERRTFGLDKILDASEFVKGRHGVSSSSSSSSISSSSNAVVVVKDDEGCD